MDMKRLGGMMMMVARLHSRGMRREDAERVFAGQGEGEGRLLGRRELLKVLRLAAPHLATRLLNHRKDEEKVLLKKKIKLRQNCASPVQ